MPLLDSATGAVRKTYSVDELKEAAQVMRGYNLISLPAAGSGHSGGTLSIMDLTAALYLRVARHDPAAPSWEGRDRIIWSVGHKAPSLYLGLGMAGFYNVEDVVTLRKLGSPFQGHPHWKKLPGIEASTGSLGQGLSIAVGMALGLRMKKSMPGSTSSWETENSRKGRSGRQSWKPAITSLTTSSASLTETASRSTDGFRTT